MARHVRRRQHDSRGAPHGSLRLSSPVRRFVCRRNGDQPADACQHWQTFRAGAKTLAGEPAGSAHGFAPTSALCRPGAGTPEKARKRDIIRASPAQAPSAPLPPSPSASRQPLMTCRLFPRPTVLPRPSKAQQQCCNAFIDRCAGRSPSAVAIEKLTRRVFAQVKPGFVGLAGLEPAASSLSGLGGNALCGPAFPQVVSHRRWRSNRV